MSPPAAPAAVHPLAAALARAIARPLAMLDPGQVQIGSLTGAALVRAAAAPPFTAPLNRAVSRHLGLTDVPLDPGFLDRLAGSPRTRLSVLLVVEPLASVAAAALHVAAAILHRPVVAVVLGAQRARLRAALGEGAFEVATREAQLLHAPLVAPAGAETLGDLDDPAVLREALLRRGTRALREAVDLAEPALGPLFVRRFPPLWLDGDPRSHPLAEDRLDPLLRLLRRRMPAWAASIA